MCGIVAFHGPRSTEALELVQACLLEAAIRGTHATGIGWVEDHELFIEKAPVSAQEFVQHYDLPRLAWNEGQLSIVAHTRYSTSDLAWNQPLDDPECALVMNGVISQDSPASWPRSDDDLQPYITGNDAEVALRYASNGYRGYMPGSFAIVELRLGAMYVYRNAYRPLYHARVCGGTIVASTFNILYRCGIKSRPVPPGTVFDLVANGLAGTFLVTPEQQPLPRDPCALRCTIE